MKKTNLYSSSVDGLLHSTAVYYRQLEVEAASRKRAGQDKKNHFFIFICSVHFVLLCCVAFFVFGERLCVVVFGLCLFALFVLRFECIGGFLLTTSYFRTFCYINTPTNNTPRKREEEGEKQENGETEIETGPHDRTAPKNQSPVTGEQGVLSERQGSQERLEEGREAILLKAGERQLCPPCSYPRKRARPLFSKGY